MTSLQDAKDITTCSSHLSPTLVVRLLASNRNLAVVQLHCGMDKELVETIAPMSLPNLKLLFLGAPPKAKEAGDSTFFFKKLHAPEIDFLQFHSLNVQDLSALSDASSPASFLVRSLTLLPLKQPPLL